MLETTRFKGIIESFFNQLIITQDNITGIKLSDDKWTLKEIIGHLIDSASNNHQRFVRLQFGDLLDFPAYETEEWVKSQKYINIDWKVIVSLWYNYNLLLLNIIENIDEAVYGNVWVKNEDTALTLEHLINDYYVHLGLHVEQFTNRKDEIQG